MIDTLVQDLRYAVRTLRRSPAFTVTAILILALGIGATTSMFSLLHATLLRPLPFPESDRLVAVRLAVHRSGGEVRKTRWSYPEFEALRREGSDFEGLAAFGRVGLNLTGGGEPERVTAEVVSWSYFRILEVDAALGRTFNPDEDRDPGTHPAAILSYERWRDRFGSDSSVIGRGVRVNGVPLTVVGVMPAGFQGLSGPADLWLTHATADGVVSYASHLTTHQHFLNVVGRLLPGSSPAGATAGLAPLEGVLADTWGADHAADARYRADVESLKAARVDPEVRRARLVLFGAVVLLLLIAGADLAGLLLGRGLSRGHEMAVRRALGSSRARLVRQCLTESMVLALLGGGAGVLIAVWSDEIARSIMPPAYTGSGYGRLAQFASASIDGWVLLFAVGLSLVVGLAFGVGPALRATRRGAGPGMPSGTRGREPLGGSGGPWFSVLVVSEFALALTLLVGAGLLMETLGRMRARDASFDSRGVVTFRVEPHGYATAEGPALLGRILERVSAVPGVRSASVSPCAPFMSCASRLIRLPPDVDPDAPWTEVRRHYVAPGHFRTLGIELLRGRGVTPADRPGSPNVAVVNRHLAETFWPGQDPLGRKIVFQGVDLNFIGPDSTATVVGVVADVPFGDPAAPTGLDVYTSFRQFSWPFSYVLVRAEGVSPGLLVPKLRRAVRAVDPDLPIFDVASLDERIDQALATPRFNGALLATFAGLALLLAGVGIYGVMSQWVARRTREMGIRRAVGAGEADVLGLVVGKGLGLTLAGVAIGAVGATFASRLLTSQLYGVSAGDPGVFVLAGTFLAVVGLAAVYLPARRATRVDPVAVLRQE